MDPDPRVLDRERLEAVERMLFVPEGTEQVAGAADEALERISRLASALLGTPVSLVSLVEEDRQVFAAQVGLDDEWSAGTPLSHSFCQHVVADDAPLVVSDAREDERLRDNLAIRDLGVVAYCGVPLRAPNGMVVGSFCVIDDDPRDWTEEEVGLVTDLGALATSELIRRSNQQFVGDEHTAREIRRALRAVIGGFRTIAASQNMDVSDRALYIATVERQARHLESLLDQLLG